METKYKHLESLFQDIEFLEVNSSQTRTYKGRMEDYECASLINEATRLITELEKDISESSIKDSQDNIKFDEEQLDEYIKILSLPNPKFSDILYISEFLKKGSYLVPKSINIQENMENDISIENILK
ncbi:hypothetical protein H012_gp472 [Acanthamoeba polyphaga moumouvirus]|uniref:Uncharacterized protein n=2 Tax=Moumouvirus TaxID=3080801 RepID=L7RD39_9VIRU|nr:hypothetical protein H012_gp472 [Acanthamoeba polyphaga moumouvirus]AEX62742.1 hypothetical protein mv_R537 [Moumouvirus Monve]AGC01988.1 hypothetical protein Moumou_00452 [Acanthamoeba polyphaga moumouvirus]AQN68355.1 hypothetical protein [Saudi moumouvirus]